MTDKPKIRAFLDIRGFSTPASNITEILSIPPDEAWNKGTPIPEKKQISEGVNKTRKYSVWRINASLDEFSYEVEDYILYIINRLSSVKNKIIDLPNDVNIMLCIWIDLYPQSSMPSLGLSVNTMKMLSELNIELDIDLSLIIPSEIPS